MARRARSVLWLSPGEQALSRRLWGELPGRVTAMAVHTEPARPAKSRKPFVLYCGRIDPIKGCDHLVKFFLAYKAKHPSDLRLVLTGSDKLPLPRHPDIDYRGFVSDAEKFALMAGAKAFLMPSPYESFSVATLEALAQRTPVLVNGACDVLADHVRLSGAGLAYSDEASFLAGLGELLDEGKRAALGERGREYVVGRYGAEKVRDGLVQEVEACAVGARSVSDGVAA
jgi:glycosyltransferase involved in cell wall biosynthesis